MKGVVLEIRDGKAAVLTEDGSIITTEQSCKVGDTIEIAEKSSAILPFRRRIRRIAAAAAAVVVVSGVSLGFYTTNVMACSYVTMDVNPSFEYTLNRRNKVIGVKALDEDAETAVEAIREAVRGKSVAEAISLTADELEKEQYLDTDGDAVLFSVVSGSEEQEQNLRDAILESTVASDEKYTIRIETGDMSDRKSAQENQLSTGRYLAGYKSSNGTEETESTVSSDDLREMPVEDLMETPPEQETVPEMPSGTPEESASLPAGESPDRTGTNPEEMRPERPETETGQETAEADSSRPETALQEEGSQSEENELAGMEEKPSEPAQGSGTSLSEGEALPLQPSAEAEMPPADNPEAPPMDNPEVVSSPSGEN